MVEEYFIVSLDFDGVLAQGYKAKMKYAKDWFNVDLTLNQTKKEGFEALMKSLGRNVSYRDLMDPLNEQHIMEYEVPTGCIKTLSGLYAQNCRFVVISSRNDHDYPYAVQFIEEKFGGLIKYVHNTSNEPKGMFVKRLKPRLHVDDDIGKLLELLEYPVELVYFRQPENESQDVPLAYKNRILQAESFGDVQILVERIKALHSAICKKENIVNNWTNIGRIFGVLHSLSKNEINELLKQ
jgi:hypothetical protein